MTKILVVTLACIGVVLLLGSINIWLGIVATPFLLDVHGSLLDD